MTLPRGIGRFNTRVTNKVMRHLVGRWSFAEIEHVGRRSGRRHRTPVNAFRDGDLVVVVLTYGRDVDWLRNIRAAGGCRMRLRAEVLTLGAPQVVPTTRVAHVLPVLARPIVRLVRAEAAATMPVLSGVAV